MTGVSTLTRPRRLARGGVSHARALGPRRAACRSAARRTWPPARRAPRLTRERLARCRASAFALQRAADRARSARRSPSPPVCAGAAGVFGAFLRLPLRARRRRGKRDARTARFRQADRDRLLRRSRAVLAFPNVVDFLAYELARLRRGRFACALVLPRPLQRGFLRHIDPPIPASDATPMPSRSRRPLESACGGVTQHKRHEWS